MVTSFILNTKSEFLKSKRTAAFWLTVAGAVFIPIVGFIRMVAKPAYFVPILRKDPWAQIISDNYTIATIFLLPMYVILVTSLVVQVEYRNNTWKQVYASPRTMADIFFSRFIVIQSLILLCFILFNVSIILTSYAANLVQKQYGFFDHPLPVQKMLLLTVKIYFSVLAITSLQYWLSLQFRNFIIPMSIGLGLLITGFIINQWDHLYYYPYMYSVILYWPAFQKNPDFVNNAYIYNSIWFAGALLLGFWNMATRKEKG